MSNESFLDLSSQLVDGDFTRSVSVRPPDSVLDLQPIARLLPKGSPALDKLRRLMHTRLVGKRREDLKFVLASIVVTLATITMFSIRFKDWKWESIANATLYGLTGLAKFAKLFLVYQAYRHATGRSQAEPKRAHLFAVSMAVILFTLGSTIVSLVAYTTNDPEAVDPDTVRRERLLAKVLAVVATLGEAAWIVWHNV